MQITKFALALTVTLAGLAGASQAQAAAGTFQIGHSAFEDRCEAYGGELFDAGTGIGCDIGTVQIGCAFIGATTYCEWNGAQNQRDVRRILGAELAQSLSTPVDGKKKGGIKLPPFNNILVMP
jgi:hypothetical protein